MMRTRILFFSLAVLMILVLVLSGCGSKTTPTPTPTATTQTPTSSAPAITTTSAAPTTSKPAVTTSAPTTAAPKTSASPTAPAILQPWDAWPIKQINPAWNWPKTILANGAGGRYTMLVGLGDMFKRYVTGGELQVLDFSGTQKGVSMVLKDEALFAVVGADGVTPAYRAEDIWKAEKPGQLRTLAITPITTRYALFARNGSGIKTYADLKGKRVAAYNPAATVYTATFELSLKAHGLTPADIKQIPNTALTELVPMLRENRADAAMLPGDPGHQVPSELTQAGDGYMVMFDMTKTKALEVSMQGTPYAWMEIPTGSFKGQDQPGVGIGPPEFMFAKASMPDSLAYTIVRIMFDNQEEFGQYGSGAKKYLPYKIIPSFISTPVHPGAIKYYKEKGLWGPEQEAANLAATLK